MLYCENKAETKQRECAAAAGGDAAECQRETRAESGFLYFKERLNQVLQIHSDDGTFKDIGETITGQPHQH